MPGEAPRCGECGGRMHLRQTTRYNYRNGQPRRFYGCENYPNCRGIHGAHPNGKPLGEPADKSTRQARMALHTLLENTFGKWDTATREQRKAQYRWLAKHAPKKHISQMTTEDVHATALALLRGDGLDQNEPEAKK